MTFATEVSSWLRALLVVKNCIEMVTTIELVSWALPPTASSGLKPETTRSAASFNIRDRVLHLWSLR